MLTLSHIQGRKPGERTCIKFFLNTTNSSSMSKTWGKFQHFLKKEYYIIATPKVERSLIIGHMTPDAGDNKFNSKAFQYKN